MFKRWFRKFFSIFNKKKTLDTTHIIKKSEQPSTEKVVAKKERTTKGYRTSPYNTGFTKPENGSIINKTLSPNISKDSTPPTPTSTPAIQKTSTVGSINFYETVESVSSPVQVKVNEPVTEAVHSPVKVMEEQPIPTEYITPQDGKLFVMNGYGVDVVLTDGRKVVAYLDTGEDKNIDYDTPVVLSQWNGPLDKIAGKTVSETGTERPGKSDDVLIQNV